MADKPAAKLVSLRWHGTTEGTSKAGKELANKQSKSEKSTAGKASRDSLSSKERSKAASHAATERWGNKDNKDK